MDDVPALKQELDRLRRGAVSDSAALLQDTESEILSDFLAAILLASEIAGYVVG
jgi:hypothetical protein